MSPLFAAIFGFFLFTWIFLRIDRIKGNPQPMQIEPVLSLGLLGVALRSHEVAIIGISMLIVAGEYTIWRLKLWQ